MTPREPGLRELRERLLLALETSGIGTFMWYLDEDRVDPDARMLALLGLPADAALDLVTLGGRVCADHAAHYAEAVARAKEPSGPGTLREEVRVVLPGGRERWIALNGQVMFDEGRRRPVRMVGTAFDLTERKRHERNAEFLNDVARAFSRLSSPEEIMKEIGERLGAFLEVATVCIVDIDEPSDQGRVHCIWRTPEAPAMPQELRISAAIGDDLMRSARADRTVVVSDTRTDPRDAAAHYDMAGFRASISVPIHRDGKWRNLLSVLDTRPREWRDDQVALVQELANQLFPRLDRARAEQTLRESEARYRRLFESIDEGFCIIEVLFDDEGRPHDYRFIEVNPAFERHTGLVGAIGKRMREFAPLHEEYWFEIYGQVAITGEPARFERPADQLGRHFDVYAFRVGEPEDRRVAVLFNDITERKRVEVASRRAAEADAYRVALADALRPIREPAELQATACRVLGEALGASRVAYFEATEDEYVIGRDWVDGVRSMTGRYRRGAFGPRLLAGYQTGRPVVAEDVQADAGLSSSERAAYADVSIRAYIGVPLLKGGDLVAGLAVHSAVPRAWAPPEIALVEETAERTWAAVERAKAEAALHEADRRKDEFLATLAHELRNPLAPIRTGLELLRRGPKTPETVEQSLAMMERQVGQLVHLVDDLLDVSRITLGKIQLRPELTDLAAVARDAVDMSRSVIDEAGHELTVELPREPVHLRADRARLAQVVANLLNNAAKYTPQGGRIALTVRQEPSQAVVSVRDNGIGITPDQAAGIFDLFSQFDGAPEQSQGGLGIGLTLVKQLVELHGGTVSVESEGAGSGAEFIVRLPLASAGRTEETATADLRAAPLRRRLLVVDDNRDAADTLGMILEHEGADVRTAYDGLQALETAARFRPEVALLDLRMPRLDGFATAKRLRAEPWGKHIVLIALTGWGQDKDRQRTREAGFDHHLVKPVDAASLRRLLERSAAERRDR